MLQLFYLLNFTPKVVSTLLLLFKINSCYRCIRLLNVTFVFATHTSLQFYSIEINKQLMFRHKPIFLSKGKKSYLSPAAQVLKRLFLKQNDEKGFAVEAKLGLLTPPGHLTRELTVSVSVRSTEKEVISIV